MRLLTWCVQTIDISSNSESLEVLEMDCYNISYSIDDALLSYATFVDGESDNIQTMTSFGPFIIGDKMRSCEVLLLSYIYADELSNE